MTLDPSLFTKRIRQLSWALIVSGMLNIGVLFLFLYWILSERSPAPYCELKPASSEQQQPPLADQRGSGEILAQLSQYSFHQLINSLSHSQLIENGYAERDLALAYLIAYHHFDIQRALPRNAQPQQSRLLTWKPKGKDLSIKLVVYPDLTQQQFDHLIRFAQTERWPLTAEGLFLMLKNQNENESFDKHLCETFGLTSEFWTVELLFNRLGQKADREDLLRILLDGDWNLLKQFVDQQRQVHDSSDARRQRFLLDYIQAGSPFAVILFLKTDWDFAVKKLDDQQVLAILKLMSIHFPEGVNFAKEMLSSPRSTNVWRHASQWLYRQAGETMPIDWTHYAALKRFVPEKASLELVSKPVNAIPGPMTPPLPLPPAKTARVTPIKPKTATHGHSMENSKAKGINEINEVIVKKGADEKKAHEKIKPIEMKIINEKANSKEMNEVKKKIALKTAKSVSISEKGANLKKEPVAMRAAKSPVNTTNTSSKAAKKLRPSLPLNASTPLSIYIVQEGDTLWKIAKRFNVKVDELKRLNQLNNDSLSIGMSLKLPIKQ